MNRHIFPLALVVLLLNAVAALAQVASNPQSPPPPPAPDVSPMPGPALPPAATPPAGQPVPQPVPQPALQPGPQSPRPVPPPAVPYYAVPPQPLWQPYSPYAPAPPPGTVIVPAPCRDPAPSLRFRAWRRPTGTSRSTPSGWNEAWATARSGLYARRYVTPTVITSPTRLCIATTSSFRWRPACVSSEPEISDQRPSRRPIGVCSNGRSAKRFSPIRGAIRSWPIRPGCNSRRPHRRLQQ